MSYCKWQVHGEYTSRDTNGWNKFQKPVAGSREIVLNKQLGAREKMADHY